MKIMKRKIKNIITVTNKRINGCVERINWRYFAMVLILLVGVGGLVFSCWIDNLDRKNIFVGLGTGIITSTLVTLYLEMINAKIEGRKIEKYKKILLNPLCSALKSIYIIIVLRVNEYRVRENLGEPFLLPLKDTKELSEFFKKMEKIDLESIENEKDKNKLEEFSSVSLPLYKEVISQYERLPFESLLLDNIITQEEYNQLKRFKIVNECKRLFNVLSDKKLEDNEKYSINVHLMHVILLFISRLIKIFDFLGQNIEAENKWIKNHLDGIYFYEVYCCSQEYIEGYEERAKAEIEYYATHPEELEELEKFYSDMEESEQEKLLDKICNAIWMEDAETIKECFPQIDKDDEQIQAELVSSYAKKVMKNRELRKLYFQKYGISYKLRKEKKK